MTDNDNMGQQVHKLPDDQTEIGRLQTIRDHLRTGAVGQREVWEEWLAEAIDELDQLTGSKNALQVEIDRLRKLNDDQQAEMLSWHMQLTAKDNEIKQLKHAASVDFTQWRAETVRLNKEIKRLQEILDGTERRECEYLALIEKHATENEARRVQWEEAKREAEKWVHESGVRLGQAHKLLHERNDEIARLRGNNTKLETENERLKAERHTTKRMLKDILDRHGYSGWDAART